MPGHHFVNILIKHFLPFQNYSQIFVSSFSFCLKSLFHYLSHVYVE